MHTESDESIAHPRGSIDGLVRSEAGNFVASKEVPNDGSQACVVTDDQAAGALANIVGGDEQNVVTMSLEATLDRESVVVQTEDGVALGMEEKGSGGSAGLESLSNLFGLL